MIFIREVITNFMNGENYLDKGKQWDPRQKELDKFSDILVGVWKFKEIVRN